MCMYCVPQCSTPNDRATENANACPNEAGGFGGVLKLREDVVGGVAGYIYRGSCRLHRVL